MDQAGLKLKNTYLPLPQCLAWPSFNFLILIFCYYFYLYVLGGGMYTLVCVCACRGQRGCWLLLVRGLQAFGSHLIWVLGVELGSLREKQVLLTAKLSL